MSLYCYIMDKEECERKGGEWIQGYRKKDRTYVKSYCRVHDLSYPRFKYKKEPIGDQKGEFTKYNNYDMGIIKDPSQKYTYMIMKDNNDLWMGQSPTKSSAKKALRRNLKRIEKR